MPAATQTVRCVFRVKTGAFYGQEGGMSTASDGGVVRDWHVVLVHDPPPPHSLVKLEFSE